MSVNNNITSQGIDERLMSAQRASELREEKNKASNGDSGTNVSEDQEGNTDIRQSKLAALKEKANLKKRANDKIKEKVFKPAKLATGAALKWAWGALIPSFGLTIIYVNMHVFLRFIFPDAFCKLGEEWIPKVVSGDNTAKNVAGTAFGLVEIIALVLIDLIIFITIVALIYFLILLADIIENPVKSALNISWGWIREVFSNFFITNEGIKK